MKPSSYPSNQNHLHEWVSAIGTLIVLCSIYASMDNFSSYAWDQKKESSPPISSLSTLSVTNPYWNQNLGYGFRSISGDTYSATRTQKGDQVLVKNQDISGNGGEVKVSFYRDTPIDVIDKGMNPDTPRAYSRLSHGIAVIEGDLDSPRAKTIFSTLHSD